MKKEELKPFTKRVSICRVEDSKTGKTKQIKKTTTVYAKSKKEADEKFAEFKKKERDRILNIKEQRTLGDVIECFYKENTQYSINTVVKRKWYRKKIEDKFGSQLIYAIEGNDIKQFLRDLRDENGYSDVRVDTGTAIYDADGNPTGETVLATEDFFVKVAEVEETKNDFVNVGDIEYTVLDANGNVVARGVLEADPANPGRYEDDPYDTIEGGLTELPKGTYTIVLNPLGGVYALVPTEKTFTVGSTPTPTPGPDPDPTPTPPTPTLIKDDHFAYMVGSGGAFRPTDNLTRAEAAQVLYNLLTDKTMGDRDVTFSDVTEERWFYTAVMTLASHGIIRGYSDGTFRPNAYITRAEFATLCSRFDDLTDGDMTFSDVPETHWAYKYIVSAASKGWITGYSDGTFRPDNNILRGEVVALLNRVLERYPDKEFIDAHEAELRSFSDVSKSYWNYYGIMEAANGHNYTKENKEETWISLK